MPPGLGFQIHDSKPGASLAKLTSAGLDLRGIHTPRTFDHPAAPYARLIFCKGLLLMGRTLDSSLILFTPSVALLIC